MKRLHYQKLWVAVVLFLLGCPDLEETAIDTDTNTGAGTDLADSPTDRVLEEMADIIEDFMIPGLSVAMIDAEGTLWSGGVGVSDYDLGTEMTGTTSLKAGSTTKTLTGARALQLIESGELALEDEVSTYVDVLPAKHGITVQQLLNHSSGLGDYTQHMTLPSFQGSWNPRDLIALLVEDPLLFDPGTSYSYSNANFILLGLIIEAITGEPWSTELNTLLASVGITSAWIPAPDEDWGACDPGYFVYPDGELHSEFGQTYNTVNAFHHSVVGAAGNLVSDAEGLAKWGDAYWGGDGVISSDTKDAMITTLAPNSNYGLAVDVLSDLHGAVWDHNGAVNGYEAYVGYRPDDGVTLAFLGNAWLSVGDNCCSPTWNWDVAERLWFAFYSE